jgi:CrcB protein
VQSYLIVFFGAGIGGAMRHGVNEVTARLGSSGSALGTLFVNVVGSLAMGMLVGYLALRGEASQHWRLFLTTGILGGFTTFSTYSLDIALLHERGETVLAAGHAIGSVILAVGALMAGMWLMRQLP